jgi:hypothetical protein
MKIIRVENAKYMGEAKNRLKWKGSFRRREGMDLIQRTQHTYSAWTDIFWFRKGRENFLNGPATIGNSTRRMSWSNVKETLDKIGKFN